jgi:hypothetical protein
MINQELLFKYNINFHNIYDLALENNKEFIKVIPEIVFYQKGTWKNNKRIDFIKINIFDIPTDLNYIINMMKDNNGLIGIKIKIKKILFDDKIIIKTKLKLEGYIGCLINNAVNLQSTIIINNEDNIKTNIKVNYIIKSFLINEEMSKKINIHIQNKLENYYIKNINKYFLELT